MERICNELELLLSDIIFCGFDNIYPEMYEKLIYISKYMEDIGMIGGKQLVDRLYNEISAFRRQETDGNSLPEIIGNLEFYIKNIKEN